MYALLMLVALGIEAALGWPKAIYKLVGHPVVWVGALISRLDRVLNRSEYSQSARRALGVVTVAFVVVLVASIAIQISYWLGAETWGFLLEAAIASSLIASRSLYDHVDAVARPLQESDLPAARVAVSHIVGRDPSQLDASGVARASMESLAENTSDGIVAPVFWGCIFGLPGIAAYKAINTLDSMIGHHGERYGSFGWASAKLDDVANFLPARLTALLFILSSGSLSAASVVREDATLHRSPNAGWPEAALAGVVGVRLSGPRSYQGIETNEPWVNGGDPDPDAFAIRQGLRYYVKTMLLLAVVLTGIAYLESVR